MPADESYYLLTTFANMAMARGDKDYDFVKATTINLFRVCLKFYVISFKC